MTFVPSPIAVQNDDFRKHVGIEPHPTLKGAYHITRAVAALPVEQQQTLLAAIREFNKFEDGNFDGIEYDATKDPAHEDYQGSDPYAEHDFGTIGEHCFKIDYWSDSELVYGSDDPADPNKTYRVMTIMRLSDW